MQIAFTLGREERIVILEHLDTEQLDEFFVARLKKTERDAARLNFELPETAFEALARALVEAFDEKNDAAQDEIGFVMHAIATSAHPVGGEAEEFAGGPPPGSPAHTISVEVERLIKERGAETIEEAQAILEEVQDAYNKRPQEELGGFSPHQMMRLFAHDWHSANSGIQVRPDLPLEAAETAEIFVNTRLLLRMLKEEGGAKATPKGNLNTKFVKAYAERMHFPDPTLRDFYMKSNKSWQEDRTGRLGDTRFVAQLAGLLRKYKGKFVITKLGQELLEDADAGELYMLLFDNFFRRFDLACLDGAPEAPSLQESFPYTLAKLHLHARQWINEDALVGELFLPQVIAELAETTREPERVVRTAAMCRVFHPLERFGLLEMRNDESEPDRYRREVRVTALFDKFFVFDLDSPIRR